ncbi:MAG: FHIPEP family type III secretion protein [Candidatus Eremiobacteraeota bacterium]|nr:FHIPEP family type III secretion protein [Candidatus Eremiobacteraeota bacterium]
MRKHMPPSRSPGCPSLLTLLCCTALILLIPALIYMAPVDSLIFVSLALSLLLTLLASSGWQAFTRFFPTAALLVTFFQVTVFLTGTAKILSGAIICGHGGSSPAGTIIPSCGNLIVSGNSLTGLLMFIALAAIQILFIMSHSERISQMAARFTLDAMPGFQMAVDADFHSGLATAEAAKARRRAIESLADFYGSMDGLANIKRYAVIAELAVMALAALAGTVKGVLAHMEWHSALHNLIPYIIGNGALATASSLLVSTAMNVVGARECEKANFGEDIVKQQTKAAPGAFYSLAVIFGVLGLLDLTGILKFSRLPWFLAAEVCVLMGKMVEKKAALDKVTTYVATGGQSEKGPSEPQGKAVQEFSAPQAPPLSIEFHPDLYLTLDQQCLAAKAVEASKTLSGKLGFPVPAAQFLPCSSLSEKTFVIRIHGITAAAGFLEGERLLAKGPVQVLAERDGIRMVEHCDSSPGLWIERSGKDEALNAGLTLLEPADVLVKRLEKAILLHAPYLLDRSHVTDLISNGSNEWPELARAVKRDSITVEKVEKTLQNLLWEGLPIAEIKPLMNIIACNRMEDPETLAELGRLAMKKAVCCSCRDSDGTLHALFLDDEIKDYLLHHLCRTCEGSYLALDPETKGDLLLALAGAVRKLAQAGHPVVLITEPALRPSLKRLTDQLMPDLPVLSSDEMTVDSLVVYSGLVSLNDSGRVKEPHSLPNDFPEPLASRGMEKLPCLRAFTKSA